MQQGAPGPSPEPPPTGAPGMVRADFWFSLVLIALGLATVVESWRMPRFENLDVNPYTVPGLVPGLLGLIILVLGAALCLRAARAGGWRRTGEEWLATPGTPTMLLAALLCLVYAAGLVSRVPFWLATWLFVATFVALFEWGFARSQRERWWRVAFAIGFGAVVAAVVSFVFQEIFLVRLP